jgi:uncharacterized protein YyaL (SSP411 family)
MALFASFEMTGEKEYLKEALEVIKTTEESISKAKNAALYQLAHGSEGLFADACNEAIVELRVRSIQHQLI